MKETAEVRTQSLAERLEDHTGAWDSRMDAEVALALGWDEVQDGWHQVDVFFDDGQLRRTSYPVELPAFTHSLDAAMNLIPPPGFPLWTLKLNTTSHGRHGMSFCAEVTVPSREARGVSRCRPALAVCAAALRAREFFK